MTERDVSGVGAVLPCWSCKGPTSPRALFCSTCGAVQAPGQVDHFHRLGLPAGFDLDPAALDRQYFGLQRRLHPDRFATRSARERALSQQQATAMNEAYETLKDPLKRAAYLLRLAGRPVDVERAVTVDDPALLTEALEMREALADAETVAEVADLAQRAEGQAALCREALARAFAGNDLERAGKLTTRLKYLDKMIEEARARKTGMTRQGL